MNIFNSGRIITLLRKHPSSHFRPSLLMQSMRLPLNNRKNRLENSFTKICWICFRKSPESLTKIRTCVDLPSPKNWCLPLYLLSLPPKRPPACVSLSKSPPSKPASSHCPINWKKPKLSRPTRLFSCDIHLEWTSSFRTYLLTPNSDLLEIEQNQLIEASSTPSTK